MKRVFDKIDVDDSKSISRDEMHDLLIDLGIDPHDENKELEGDALSCGLLFCPYKDVNKLFSIQ